MICENCGIEINENYGSGRFCGPKCARGFATKSKRLDINKKVSRSLKGRKYPGKGNGNRTFSNDDRIKAKETKRLKRETILNTADFNELPMSLKRQRIFNEQKGECLCCKNSIWNDKLITLELDHISGNKKDNTRNNLRLLCPNCHAQTPTWRKGTGVLSIDETELIKVANVSNSLNEILKHFELPWGSSKTLKKLLIKHNLDEKFR